MKKITIILILLFLNLFIDSQQNHKISIVIDTDSDYRFTEVLEGFFNFYSERNLTNLIKIEFGNYLTNNIEKKVTSIIETNNNIDTIEQIITIGDISSIVANKICKSKNHIAITLSHPDILIKQKNLCGVSLYNDPEILFSYFKQIYPDIKKIGYLYYRESKNIIDFIQTLVNINNTEEMSKIENYCSKNKIILNKEIVSDYNEISVKTFNLVNKDCKVIIVSNNKIFYDNFNTILNITNKSNIPVISFDIEFVKKGALFGLKNNNNLAGKMGAEISYQILYNNKKPEFYNFKFNKELKFVINMKNINNYNITIPEHIINNSIRIN